MRVSSTIKALRERCPSFKNRVFGAIEWTSLSALNPADYPAAYVFTVSENPKDLQRTENWYYQEITATIAVVIAVPSSDLRGQDAGDLIEDLKEEVFKAILSWAPNDDRNCVYEYSNYRVLDTGAAPKVWFVQLEFSVDYVIGYGDTRQPEDLSDLPDATGNKPTVGRLDKLYTDVDMIGDEDKPDGIIDGKLRLKNIYDGKTEPEAQDPAVFKDLW